MIPVPTCDSEHPTTLLSRLAVYAKALGWEVVRDSPQQTSCRRWNVAGTETQWIVIHAHDKTWQRDPSFSVTAETRDAKGRFLQGGAMRVPTVAGLFDDAARALGAPRS